MPLSQIAAVLTAITHGKNLATSLYKYLTEKKDLLAAEQVSQIQTLLFDLQNSLIEVNNKNIELGGQLRVLEEKLEHRRKLIRRNGYYEFVEPVEGYGKGPFCLQCTDINRIPVSVPVNHDGFFLCSGCQTNGWLEGREPHPRPRRDYDPSKWMDRK